MARWTGQRRANDSATLQWVFVLCSRVLSPWPFYGFFWASLNANERRWDHPLGIYTYINTSMKEIAFCKSSWTFLFGLLYADVSTHLHQMRLRLCTCLPHICDTRFISRSMFLCCWIVFCLVPHYTMMVDCAQAFYWYFRLLNRCHVNWINIHVTEVTRSEILLHYKCLKLKSTNLDVSEQLIADSCRKQPGVLVVTMAMAAFFPCLIHPLELLS